MKKAYGFIIILAACAAAHAGIIDLVITGTGPSLDTIFPIQPTKHILVMPSDYIWIDVIYSGNEGLYAMDCYFNVMGGSATMEFSQTTYPLGMWELTWPGSGGFVDAGGPYAFVSAGLIYSGIPADGAEPTIVLSHILLHREDYISPMWVVPSGTEVHGGSLQWDFSAPTFGTGITLGIPEPITISMLGFGTILGLRRRR